MLPFRPDLQPLCPEDSSEMLRNPEMDNHSHFCGVKYCGLLWKREDGYSVLDLDRYAANLVKWLSVGVNPEHGYLYIGAAEGLQKTWMCSVKDCGQTLTE